MCIPVDAASLMESQGDKRDIIHADLKKAGDASKISVKEAVRTSRRRSGPRTLVRLLGR
jgi:hypothetical protein